MNIIDLFKKYKNFLFLTCMATSSMVGSSVFVLPATLGRFGFYSIIGCVIASCVAVCLSFIFATLCEQYPEQGGPHVYIKHAFGHLPAKIFGIIYWLVSWISSSIVIITAVLYFEQLIPFKHPYFTLSLQLLLLLFVTILNCRNIQTSATVEIILTVFFKFFVLLIIPFIILNYFDISNFKVLHEDVSAVSLLNETTIIAFWGFVGVECVTTIAGTIKDSQHVFKKAIILGTVIAAFIYLLNYITIQASMPAEELCVSGAPYVAVIKNIFGDFASYFISAIGCIVCIGTLNAWTLASGQIASGLAVDNYLPHLFSKKSKHGAPYISVLASSVCLVVILCFTLDKSAMKQLENIIDCSTITFAYIYLICSLAYLKILTKKSRWYEWGAGIFSIVFCVCMSLYFSWILFVSVTALFAFHQWFVNGCCCCKDKGDI